MAINRAATLSDQQFSHILREVTEHATRPFVDRAAFLLSFKAGLRAQEIAGLRWKTHVLGPDGDFRQEEFLIPGARGRVKRDVYPVLFISSDIGKYGSERSLRVHPMLLTGLQELRESAEFDPDWVIPSGRNGATQELKARAHALALRLNRTYIKLGFENCTSHSGRRTFITKASKRANLAGCSIRDVQVMAGHKDMSTTEHYIDVSTSQADLVGML